MQRTVYECSNCGISGDDFCTTEDYCERFSWILDLIGEVYEINGLKYYPISQKHDDFCSERCFLECIKKRIEECCEKKRLRVKK